MDLLNLPDFFSNKTFFLFGDFDSDERRMLIRYITAYDGWVVQNVIFYKFLILLLTTKLDIQLSFSRLFRVLFI